MARQPSVSGVALVDKPAGPTSHDVVQQLRRGLRQREVGHTGTLDPAATGLMVVTLGRATRIARFLEATDKRYEAVVELGRSTTTWDGAGETLEVVELPPLDRSLVERALAGLVGRFEQEVPAYSAVKVNGERLYAKARRGEATTGPRRWVDVHGLTLLGYDPPRISLCAQVSKGTYIRSLAVELGRRLGVPAHLAQLRRTAVGPHRVEDAHPPERFALEAPPVMAPAEALCHLPALTLDGSALWHVAHGRRIRGPSLAEGWLSLLDPSGALVAVARAAGEAELAYEVVLVRPEDLARTV